MSFREGLEALLIISFLAHYLRQVNAKRLLLPLHSGIGAGVVFSILIGIALFIVSEMITSTTSTIGKFWESIFSLIAVMLIISLIVWMIRHTHDMKEHIEHIASSRLSSWGMFFVAFVMVAREGVEIVVFAFAGHYETISIIVGILLALVLVTTLSHSLKKISLQNVFGVTLVYLILQAGYLFGYSIHEGLSAIKEIGIISDAHELFRKLFDLSGTTLDHKDGLIGLPLNVLLGWYSKPEWIQFIAQYALTGGLLAFWRKHHISVRSKK